MHSKIKTSISINNGDNFQNSFYENNTYCNCYNCEDLKAITIEVDDEEITLYDYLDNYLSNGIELSLDLESLNILNQVKNILVYNIL